MRLLEKINQMEAGAGSKEPSISAPRYATRQHATWRDALELRALIGELDAGRDLPFPVQDQIFERLKEISEVMVVTAQTDMEKSWMHLRR